MATSDSFCFLKFVHRVIMMSVPFSFIYYCFSFFLLWSSRALSLPPFNKIVHEPVWYLKFCALGDTCNTPSLPPLINMCVIQLTQDTLSSCSWHPCTVCRLFDLMFLISYMYIYSLQPLYVVLTPNLLGPPSGMLP